MVSEEVKMFEEEQRTATAVIQAKKCAWTKWNDIESIKLSWKFLIAMEPRAISFLLHSTFDRLPNVTYQKLWGYTNLDLCFSCKSDWGTLHHVLSSCPQSLLRYTCWHNKVSEVVIECEAGNQQPFPAKETYNSVSQGRWMLCDETKNSNMKLLNGVSYWKVSVDLKTSLQFPVHIIQTENL